MLSVIRGGSVLVCARRGSVLPRRKRRVLSWGVMFGGGSVLLSKFVILFQDALLFNACCTLIPQVAALVLSRVT